MSVKATSLTSGSVTPRPGDTAAPYRWRKHPDWYGGNPKYRETEPQPTAGGRPELKTAARAQRVADFTAARAQGKTVLEAGRAVNVTPKIARVYERERLAAIREAQP